MNDLNSFLLCLFLLYVFFVCFDALFSFRICWNLLSDRDRLIDWFTSCYCNYFGGSRDIRIYTQEFQVPIRASITFSFFCGALRSRLDYGYIWNPGYRVHTDNLEKIQRRFLQYVSFKTCGIYPIRDILNEYILKIFHVVSIKKRRAYLGILFLRNILRFKIDCPYLLA